MNDEDLSELVSDFISNELADFINGNQELIGGYIEDIVYEVIDRIQNGEGGSENGALSGLIAKCLPL